MWNNGMTFRLCGTVLTLLMLSTGCTRQDWDWLGFNGKKENDRPVTKARDTSPRQVTAATQAPKTADDPSANDLDRRVDQYVQSMSPPRYDPTYQRNDFRSKIDRQNDPQRRKVIRQTALRTGADDSRLSGDPRRELRDGAADAQNRPAPATDSPADEKPQLNRPRTGGAPPVTIADVAGRDEGNGPTRNETAPRSEPAHDPAGSADEATWASDTTSAGRPLSAASTGRTPDSTDGGQPRADSSDADPAAGTSPVRLEPQPVDEEKPAAPAMKPPVLEALRINPKEDGATDKPADRATAAADAPFVSANQRADASNSDDSFKQRIAAQEKRVASAPNDLEEQFRLRMMYLIDGQDEKALAPTPGVDSDANDIMEAQIRAMMAARSDAGRDPATWANRQLEAVEALRNELRARADLQVPRVVPCMAIEGFGRYDPIDPAEFPVGKTSQVLLYIEVDNFSTERTSSGMYRTLLSVRPSLLTDDGEELWSTKASNIEDLARRPRHDFFLTYGPLKIPPSLAAGQYVFKVEVEDVLAGKLNSNLARFTITQ